MIELREPGRRLTRPAQRIGRPHVPPMPYRDAMLRQAKSTRPMVAPLARMDAMGNYQELEGLGFSLKPPKKVRQAFKAVKKAITIKNVAKVAAVGGALVAAPYLLPVLAHGAVAAGGLLARGAAAGARAVGGGISRLIPHRGPTQAPTPPQEIPDVLTAQGQPASAGPAAPTVYAPAVAPAAAAPTEAAGSSGGGTYGGDMTTPSAQPADQAVSTAGPGAGSNLLPLAIGAGVLLLMASRTRVRRK